MGKFGKTFSLTCLFLGLLYLVVLLKVKIFGINHFVEKGISPISSDLDIPYKDYEINSNSDTVLITETGTTLHFSSGIFRNKKHIPITGTVKVKIREFHSPSDLLRAGIPMRLRGEKDKYLMSAGMLEIRAYQNSTELYMAPGKFINVNLAAYRSSKNHQLFYLKDDISWQAIDTFNTVFNQRKKLALDKHVKISKELNIQKKRNDEYFELFSDYDGVLEVQPWLGQHWRIIDCDKRNELQSLKRINWDSVTLRRLSIKKQQFRLTFWKTMFCANDSPSLTKIISLKATPVNTTKTKSENALLIQNRIRKADSIRSDIQQELLRLRREADLLNTFKVNQMGVWNIDKVFSLSDFIQIHVNFDFENEINSKSQIRLFCILKKDNSVLEYNNWRDFPIHLTKDRQIELIAILPDKKVAYVDYNEIKYKLQFRSKKIIFQTRRIDLEKYLTQLSSKS